MNVDVARLRQDDERLNFIISHPENIIKPAVKKILMTEKLSKRVSVIGIMKVAQKENIDIMIFRPP